MIIRSLFAIAILLLPVRVYAQTETVYADRLSVGSGVPGTAPASTTSVRLAGLATTGGNQVLLIDSSTLAVMRRVLAKADLPAVTAYTDVTNTFALNQIFTLDIAIQGGDITSSGALTLRPTGNLTLDPTGDVIIGADGFDTVPAVGYTQNLGALTNKFLTLHAAELWVETLVAQNTIATIGGRILVGPTTTLIADMSAGATTMDVKHNQISVGDRLVMQANGSTEWFAVTAGTAIGGGFRYTVTRNLDGSGANAWSAGDAVFNTGTTGNGFIDLYSVAGVLGAAIGPTIAGQVRTGTTYSQLEPRWGIGNLNGMYGYVSTIYGVGLGDGAAAHMTIEATNGVRFRNATTTLMQLSANELNLMNTGVIKSGSATALGAGTGIWLAANSGTPQFRIGDPAGNRVQWDGMDLQVQSADFIVDATGVRLVNPTGSASATRSYAFDLNCTDMMVAGFGTGSFSSMSLQGPSGACDQAIEMVASNSGGDSAQFSTTTNRNGTSLAAVVLFTSGGIFMDSDAASDTIKVAPTDATYAVVQNDTTGEIYTRRDVLDQTIVIGACTMIYRTGLLVSAAGC